MQVFTIHPTIRLFLWGLITLVVQTLGGATILFASLFLLCVGWRALKRGGRLVWRTRWFSLSLFVVFAWGGAGTPLWDFGFSPTEEGVAEALTHLGRFMLVLMAVATFLEHTSIPDLLAATHGLLKPLRRMGFNPDRGVVRLMLVLRYVEALPRPRDWRTLLESPEGSVLERVEVTRRRLCGIDYLVTLVLVGGVILYFVF